MDRQRRNVRMHIISDHGTIWIVVLHDRASLLENSYDVQSGGFAQVVDILFVGNAQSRKLNQTYRNQDHATNVLTFSLDLPSSKNPKTCADLIFCIPVINQEARAQKKDPIKHLTHLIIHGVLHAQGYDHENTKQAQVMENLEIAILKKLGIENPYVIPNRVS